MFPYQSCALRLARWCSPLSHQIVESVDAPCPSSTLRGRDGLAVNPLITRINGVLDLPRTEESEMVLGHRSKTFHRPLPRTNLILWLSVNDDIEGEPSPAGQGPSQREQRQGRLDTGRTDANRDIRRRVHAVLDQTVLVRVTAHLAQWYQSRSGRSLLHPLQAVAGSGPQTGKARQPHAASWVRANPDKGLSTTQFQGLDGLG